MILFLDFDGVLHPELQEESSFCYLPRLERVLDDYPHVRVVISSAWRERLSLQALRELFSEPLRHRMLISAQF